MSERIEKIPKGWIILGLAFLAWWAILFPLAIILFNYSGN